MEYEKLKRMKLCDIKEICKQKHIKYHNKKKSDLINILINMNMNTNTDYNSFSINENQIHLNDQQQKIVTAELNENMRVIACAGSGKTTTIICRLKYLIDSNIDPTKIMITTFNVDAAKSIENKIIDLFGYMPNITLGTIDSISKKFYYKFRIEENKGFLGVSEYSNKLLNYLNSSEGVNILNKYEYLFFDEFQDINNIQFEIVVNFHKNGSKIILIGDDAQNIYSFRGSNIEYILNLHRYIPNFTTYKLLYNYRSTPEIIDFANNSIKNNKDQIVKEMKPVKKNTSIKPIIKHYNNLNSQNKEIIKHIVSLKYEKNVDYHEIAILSRNNYCLKILEEDFEKYNSVNINKINYVALISGNNQDKKPCLMDDHVALTTIHKSKGLEWKVVFIIGCEDKYFPSEIDNVSIQEERRLFYVAVTRAKSILYIAFTSDHITRFVGEIDKKYYNFINYKSNYFNYNQFRNSKYFNSVTEVIDNLNEEDFQNMRNKNILPNIDIKTKKIHDSHRYESNIEKYFLYSDYGTFIDRFITRSIGEKNNKSQGLEDNIANTVIAAVVIDRLYFFMYQKYKNNFLFNIDNINPQTEKKDYLKILSGNNDKNYIEDISWKDKKFVIEITEKILECSIINNFKMSDVIVVPKDYLPSGFKQEMLKSLSNYRNKNNYSLSILKDIYKISLCGNIYDQRRRLLYKDVSKNFTHNENIFQNIQNDYIKEIYQDKLLCKYNISDYNYDIHGEIDLINITQKKIIDFKCSISKEVKLEWLLQLLTYASLLKLNKKKNICNYLEIYNPLQGEIYEIDISNWNKEKEFIDYIYKSRDKKLSRNKKKINYIYIE